MLVQNLGMSESLRFKLWISLHVRSNEKIPFVFCISGTMEDWDMKEVIAVVVPIRSADSKQKGTPSFDI